MSTDTENTPWMKPRSGDFTTKKVERPTRDFEVQSYLPAVTKGLVQTMGAFFKNTKEMILGQKKDPVIESLSWGITTISYPEEKRPYTDRFRGLHRLTIRDDGSPRCVACLCCSTACPAQCIHIEAGEYSEGDPRRGYERYPAKFVIDELRCIFCGFCVEACPCDAIRMDTGLHAVPYDSREQFIYGKDLLMGMTGRDGSRLTENPRHEPGDPDHPGIDRERAH
ncbi:MAG: NADH-quinone oxidoreductase subunit I [Polyangiaceae bacterium]|nr:NADH-quinone oxidoreductase subunit I [Polyangiaceae bacterium]MBK8939620.1 NADH-quinone oxidoreductase subunit I [Polyangiaceae bacterium]